MTSSMPCPIEDLYSVEMADRHTASQLVAQARGLRILLCILRAPLPSESTSMQRTACLGKQTGSKGPLMKRLLLLPAHDISASASLKTATCFPGNQSEELLRHFWRIFPFFFFFYANQHVCCLWSTLEGHYGRNFRNSNEDLQWQLLHQDSILQKCRRQFHAHIGL